MNAIGSKVLVIGACAITGLIGYIIGLTSSKSPRSINLSGFAPSAVVATPPAARELTTASAGATDQPTETSPERTIREFTQSLREEHVARIAEAQEDADMRTWLELGIPEDKAAAFQLAKVELHQLAIGAHDSVLKLAEAKSKYDRDVEKALGQEAYQKYRIYEATKPAAREFDAIQQSLIDSGKAPIDALHQQAIIDLIRHTGATTLQSWHNPYDPSPTPRAGPKAIIEHRHKTIAQLQNTLPALRAKLAESRIPPEAQEQILSYYSNRLQDWGESISQASRYDEVKAELERWTQEQYEQAKLIAK